MHDTNLGTPRMPERIIARKNHGANICSRFLLIIEQMFDIKKALIEKERKDAGMAYALDRSEDRASLTLPEQPGVGRSVTRLTVVDASAAKRAGRAPAKPARGRRTSTGEEILILFAIFVLAFLAIQISLRLTH